MAVLAAQEFSALDFVGISGCRSGRRISGLGATPGEKAAALAKKAKDLPPPSRGVTMEDVDLSYSRSSGPGGQNVNKVETRVQASFDVDAARQDNLRIVMQKLQALIDQAALKPKMPDQRKVDKMRRVICTAPTFSEQVIRSGKATLFAPRLPPEYELWMGKILDADAILQNYGVDEVVYVDEVASWFESQSPAMIYVQRGRNSDSGAEVVPASFEGMEKYEAMMRQARPGLMEYQLESTFAYSCHYNGGCRLLSYTPIAGSGPNSAALSSSHAGAPNDRKLEDRVTHLCDLV
eukprot:g18667.t1